ncbi:TAF5-like RNA polymerase II p300/CBP-associated factor-associated factor 65 kDa subunit 5L [Stegodyphus dumicola]|uniref:TAF5-like RNA polymerase II p300/CBP-associated factor-associated factor 65 kDa subunit 5L n=1 Tax=Stegodyphus dumicola TaxID=202533 RepID=UPI0015AA8970|nr:TAF5-like RNA polymerase II p300/CBP-associated factor-associated factor 65 kDa subunit 5L [Stegodyphus dumicola]
MHHLLMRLVEMMNSGIIRFSRKNASLIESIVSKNGVQLTVGIKEMAVYSVVKSNSSIPCCITYFNERIDYHTADDEFRRFMDFIRKTSEPVKSQLTNFLYPVFVHIYLALFRDNKLSEAKIFHEAYSDIFLSAEGYNDVISDLISFKTVSDILNHPHFSLFWEEKYIIQASEDTMEQLKSYLKNVESTVLLPILHFHFYIEGDNEPQDLEYVTETIKDSVPVEVEQSRNEKLSALKNIIKKVTEGPLSLPTSYAYTIECGAKNLSAIDVNSQNSLFACAFEDAKIHILSLTSDLLESEEATDDVSNIQLAFNKINRNIKSETENGRNRKPSYNKVLRGHVESVCGLSFTPDHDLLVSCSEDCTIRAWNMKTFKNVALYYGHSSAIWDLDISSQTTYFATASKDCTARLWEFSHSSPLRIFAGHSAAVDVIRFHPNNNYIATGSSDKTIRLWTTQDARAVRCFVGHNTYISSMAFSLNGQNLATSDDDGCIIIWDLGTGMKIKELHGHTSRVLSLSFNGNSSMLASGGFDGTLKIWDVRNHPSQRQESSDKEIKDPPSKPLASYDINNIIQFVRFNAKDLLTSFATSQRPVE